MRLLIQLVKSASVEVDGNRVGEIDTGALVLLGVTPDDTPVQSSYLAEKLLNLRMFRDSQDKMNLSLLDVKGAVLVVSQFTLYGDCSDGRRPSFTKAARPELAEPLYLHFVAELKKSGLKVETGVFRAYMQVALVNDGPVTFLIDSK